MSKYLLALLFISQAHAGTFSPYRFLGPATHSIPANFTTTSTIPAAAFKSIDMGGDVAISLFKDVASPLEDLRLGVERSSTFTFSNCDAALAMPNACANASAELDQLVKSICRPESFIEKQDLTRIYDEAQHNTLLGSLQVIMSPLRGHEIPATLLPPHLVNKGRMILAKLDYKNFKASHQTASHQTASHLLKNLQRSCPSARSTAIKSEIDRIVDQVDASVAFATLENQKRAAELKSQKRCRNELPHPELTDEERVFLTTYTGALSWRIRGGALWDIGTQTRRKNFAGKIFENLIVLNANDQKLGEKYAEAAVQRLQIKGWSEWFDMGRTDDDDVLDMRGMTVRGLYQIGIGSYYGPIAGASPKEPFEKRGYDSSWLKIAGTQMGSCYMYASRFLEKKVVVEHLDSPLQHFMTGYHSEWAEACFGAVMGYAISNTLLNGRSCSH